MRRIWFSVVNFPAALSLDRYLNHPEGATPIWTPAFDWSIAAVARGLVGPDQHAVEVVAAWAPPLLGALAVVAAARLAGRTFSPAAGWVTGALLVPLPAHIFDSALGMVDHHVAVGLFATLLVAAAMRLAAPLGARGRPHGVVATGVMIAAGILLWPGFLLHVLFLQLFLLGQLLATAEQSGAVARARSLAATHAIAALLLLPFCAGREWEEYGSLSPDVLSNFQPLWFGACAAGLALEGWLWSRPALGRERRHRVASTFALAACALTAAWVLVPGLSGSVLDAATWFEADPFLGVISELQPLLSPDGRFEPANGHWNFSYLFWGYPLALAGLGWWAASRQRSDVLLLLFVSAMFCVLTLYQQRFGDVAAAGFALVMGPAIAEGLRVASHRFEAPRAVWAGAAMVAGAAALLPYAPSYRTEVIASLAAQHGARLGYGSDVRRRMVLERAAHWLARETPRTQGYLDPRLRPEYGVLCAWGQGHLLRYYAERPMVQDNFARFVGRHGFDAARRYFASVDESAAAEIADRLGVRYVVATERGSGQAPPTAESMARRLALVHATGGRLALLGGPGEALARHRLVYVADDAGLARPPGEPPWAAAVYEIVPGARVLGQAPAGASVDFELAVPLPGRAPLLYRAGAAADPSGRYEIRLPYPSEEGYAVRAGSQRDSLALSEADVREGRTVSGPSFAP